LQIKITSPGFRTPKIICARKVKSKGRIEKIFIVIGYILNNIF